MEAKTPNSPFVGAPKAPNDVVHDVATSEIQEVQKLPVASILRKLEVGDTATFPIEQRSTVMNTLSRFRSDYARMGWDADLTTNKQNFTVIVTRIG